MKGKFIYVGRLEEIKGIPLLMESWRKMGPQAPQLILCGDGPLKEWCLRFSTDHVTIQGYMPNHKVRSLIADSMALILPSQVYEGFPMVMLEAFSTGTPVIGSNIGNINDIIEEKKNGLTFQYNSEESLIETIEQMCIKPFRVKEKYIEKYSANKNYAILKNIYDSVSQEE